MRIANVAGRLAVAAGEGWLDVETASAGRFGPDPQAVYARWEEFRAWAAELPDAGLPDAGLPDAGLPDAGLPDAATGAGSGDLRLPVPRPAQVLAIGLNYRAHAAESNLAEPEHPVVFTKFPSCLAGPGAVVELPSDTVDWEVELVVVIGRQAHRVARADAWEHVAGLTIGQDLSDRVVQGRGPAPQFSLGKSFPGFGPVGPVVVTPDEFADPDDLELGCALDGEVLQLGRTKDLIFPVPELVHRLSQTLTLYPGDVIFTGTPSGVGMGRTPQRFLVPGTLVSHIEGIGTLTTTLVPAQS